MDENKENFDWLSLCFICGKSCHRAQKTVKNKQWSVVTKTEENQVYTKVQQAAEEKNDQGMLQRLHTIQNNDLSSKGARYHRSGCLVNYTKPVPSKQRKDTFSHACKLLMCEYTPKLVSGRSVFQVSTLLNRLREILHELDNTYSFKYNCTYLRSYLEKMWPEAVFFTDVGMTSLVCSKDLSVLELMRQIEQFQTLHFHKEETPKQNDEDIIHMAVAILKRRVLNMKFIEKEFFSSAEVSFSSIQEFLDPLLLKMVIWLFDDMAHTARQMPPVVNPKCISIACDIATTVRHKYTPKHMGLTLSVYKETCSKDMVTLLFHLGYGISYDELRLFLTSAAQFSTETQTRLPSGALVPSTLPTKTDGGPILCAAGKQFQLCSNKHI